MSERPINVSGPMMRAILEDRKIQTRRPVQPQPAVRKLDPFGECMVWKEMVLEGPAEVARYCPWGLPGDFTVARTADMPLLVGLEIVAVRVERLQAITPADALAGGIDYERHGAGLGDACDEVRMIYAFQALWDGIYLEEGFGWEQNPWVWKVEFRKVDE